jgi:hypothetical protein
MFEKMILTPYKPTREIPIKTFSSGTKISKKKKKKKKNTSLPTTISKKKKKWIKIK